MAPSWMEKFIVRTDATPDPRRTHEKPVLEMHYTALEGHRRILGMQGDRTPRYEVMRKAILQVWGDKCHVKSLGQDTEIAIIDFHSLPPKTEVKFLQDDYTITMKGTDGRYEARGGLGELHWKGTGMVVNGKASWELRDQNNLVMSVTIDDQQVNGLICLWKADLGAETQEDLIVVGVSKIEEYRRMIRNSKISVVGAASSAPWLLA
ncbi:hypothetical protein F53441_873 [Fusarium austroafricanum]|uniref:Uncharacterized protein n=1 Tax=Fusarium austroafricanum TaxID=2364996 RepID=A0A8H4KVV9_9HYPO|nr:hypothetical protein F53441_873 [Fusarium austroafricanum]